MMRRMIELERHEIERVLERSSILYKRLYREAPVMFFSVDPVTQCIVNCNRQSKTVIGLNKSQLKNIKFTNLFEEDCRTKVKDLLDKIISDKHSAGGSFFSEGEFLKINHDQTQAQDEDTTCYVSISISMLRDFDMDKVRYIYLLEFN